MTAYPELTGTSAASYDRTTHVDCGRSCPRCFSTRFFSKVRRTSSCWLWHGKKSGDGYGRMWMGNRLHSAHRLSYAAWVGLIPEGKEIDHLCRVRNCVNPEHLEAVTHRINTLRGDTVTAANARKSGCAKGHPYDLVTAEGGRRCRRCYNEQRRRSR